MHGHFPPERQRSLLLGALIAFTLLTACTFSLAYGLWDQHIPGALTDPLGHVASYNWPSWDGVDRGLAFPDRIVAVDGMRLQAATPGHPYPAVALSEIAQKAHLGALLEVLVEQEGGHRTMALKVQQIGWLPWLVLYASYVLVAWIWLLAAGFSYLIRPDSSGVRAFVWWSLINVVLILTFFDYNTTRTLVPLWVLAYALLPGAVLELGLRFPDEVQLVRDHPVVMWLPRLASVGVLGWVTASWYLGRADQIELVARVLGGVIMLLGVQMLYRCAVSQGRRRRQLLSALLWLPFYFCLGVLLAFAPRRMGGWVFTVVVPLHGLATLGLIYAMIRFDLWDSRALLQRRVLRPLLSAVLSLVVGLLSTILFICLVQGSISLGAKVLVVLGLSSVAVPLYRVLDRFVDRKLFPADAGFRSTVEQLSLRFIDLASRAAVVEAVESTVRQWLPCERVRFLPLPATVVAPGDSRADDSSELFRSMPPVAQMAAAALAQAGNSMSALGASTAGMGEPPEWRVVRRAARGAGISGVGSEQAAALCRGELVYPTESGSASVSRTVWAQIVIPSRFRDGVVGLLAVSSKRQAQLFTSEDEDLLRTIANWSALALACANASEQVESLRKAQQAAFREEKGAAVGTVAAEIAHEIRPIVNFFRVMMESWGARLRQGLPPDAPDVPDAEDVEIGRGEVERLERMAGNLKRIATGRTLERGTVDLRALVDHVRLLLRDRLTGRHLEVGVDALLDVDCDRDALTQILVNLVGNALDACKLAVGVGVSAEALDDGRLRLTVWDRGPGPLPELGKMFQPWFTTKANGTGLGLPITRRLVRAHGWEIGAQRRGDRTCFDVHIPLEEWHRRPPPPPEEEKFDSNTLKSGSRY